MGKLWSIIEDWRDGMDFPPSYRQIALKMGVSQSTFDTWKNPTLLPAPRNLYAIRLVTSRPFAEIVQAAIEDVELFSEDRARIEFEEYPKREATRKEAMERNELEAMRQVRREHAAAEAEMSASTDTLSPAALDAEEGIDEEPGGSDRDE